jgi:hypothetical protein
MLTCLTNNGMAYVFALYFSIGALTCASLVRIIITMQDFRSKDEK